MTTTRELPTTTTDERKNWLPKLVWIQRLATEAVESIVHNVLATDITTAEADVVAEEQVVTRYELDSEREAREAIDRIRNVISQCKSPMTPVEERRIAEQYIKGDCRDWLAAAQHYGGGFIKQFVAAVRSAEDDNLVLLLPALKQLRQKYPHYDDPRMRGCCHNT